MTFIRYNTKKSVYVDKVVGNKTEIGEDYYEKSVHSSILS